MMIRIVGSTELAKKLNITLKQARAILAKEKENKDIGEHRKTIMDTDYASELL